MIVNINPVLKEFLVKENVLDKFEHNVVNDREYDPDYVHDRLDCAFYWDSTVEGLNFWGALDKKYDKEH